MNLRLIGNLNSPWLPGAMEAMAQADLKLDAILFDPANAVGYTDAARQGLLERYERLAAQGHEIAFHASKGKSPFHYWRFGRYLRRRWANDGAPLITMYGGGLALAAATSRIRPRVHYLMGSDVLRLGRRTRSVMASLYRSADLLIANGEYLAAEAKSLTGATVQGLLLGVDLERFQPGEPPARPMQIICPRGMMGVYNNGVIGSALHWILEQEQLHGLSNPLVGCEDGLPLLQARFVSGGPLLESMRSAFSGPGISFDGGLSSDQMAKAYQSGHVVVSMSQSDGSSTAVWEALACGLVPLLSDIPANQIFRPVASLFKLDDVQGLGTALMLLATNPPEWADARIRMHSFAKEHANASENMMRLRDLLTRL